MKKDHRLLMHFLRYILLHFLLEDTDDRSEKCFIEFKTITSSFFNKKQLNSDLLNVSERYNLLHNHLIVLFLD